MPSAVTLKLHDELPVGGGPLLALPAKPRDDVRDNRRVARSAFDQGLLRTVAIRLQAVARPSFERDGAQSTTTRVQTRPNPALWAVTGHGHGAFAIAQPARRPSLPPITVNSHTTRSPAAATASALPVPCAGSNWH